MRRALFLSLLLAGCGDANPEQARVEAIAAAERAAADAADAVPCARAGEPRVERRCLVERTQGAGGLILTLRHPDGAFRRLQVTGDGHGVIAADGAEPARVTVVGANQIEVTVGGDRYRLPATVKGK